MRGRRRRINKQLSCARNNRSFTIAQIGADRLGAMAAHSKQTAIKMLQPDKGDVVQLYVVCAKDASEARFLHGQEKSRRVGRNKV